MNNETREIYRKFCETEKNLPLFSQYWWLEAVAKALNIDWGVAISSSGNDIKGVLPYIIEGKKIIMHCYTPRLGPYLVYPPNQKYQSKLQFEVNTIKELLADLPDFCLFRQSFSVYLTNWLPFYWEGFNALPRYSYIIDSATNTEDLLKEFNSNLRNKINKAEKNVIVKELLDMNAFYDLYCQIFTRKKMKPFVSREFFLALDRVCTERNCKKVLGAFDHEGILCAADYVIFDNRFAYCFLGGSVPEKRNLQAGTLLKKESILFALNNGLSFDFEGSMLKEVEPHFREFGAQQKIYFHVSKDKRTIFGKVFDALKRRYFAN